MITFVPYEYSHLIEEELRPLFEKAVALNGYTTSDDYLKNINEWEAKGGIGIHHTNVGKTIAKLKKLGFK